MTSLNLARAVLATASLTLAVLPMAACGDFAGGGGGDDHGNTCSTATSMSANSSIDGVLESDADDDFFKVTLMSAGTLTASTEGSTDTMGAILDSSCSPVVSDDDSGSGTNFRATTKVTAGTYYVAVTTALYDAQGAYTLHVDYSTTAGTNFPTRCSFDVTVVSHISYNMTTYTDEISHIVQWGDGTWTGNSYTFGDPTGANKAQGLSFTLSADRSTITTFKAATNHSYLVAGGGVPVTRDSVALSTLKASADGDAACKAISSVSHTSSNVTGFTCKPNSNVEIWCQD